MGDEDPDSPLDATLYVVDVGTRSVTAGPIALADCDEPENLVISPDNAFLFMSCAGSTVIRIATANFATTLIEDNLNDPHGVALNRAGTRLYYSNGTDAREYDTVNGVLTGTTYLDCDFYNGAVSPDGTRLYCVEEGNSVKVYNIATGGNPLADINLGASSAAAVGVRPDNLRAYIPLSGPDVVAVVDTVNLMQLSPSVPVGSSPRGIAIGRGVVPSAVPALSVVALAALTMLLAGVGFVLALRRG